MSRSTGDEWCIQEDTRLVVTLSLRLYFKKGRQDGIYAQRQTLSKWQIARRKICNPYSFGAHSIHCDHYS